MVLLRLGYRNVLHVWLPLATNEDTVAGQNAPDRHEAFGASHSCTD